MFAINLKMSDLMSHNCLKFGSYLLSHTRLIYYIGYHGLAAVATTILSICTMLKRLHTNIEFRSSLQEYQLRTNVHRELYLQSVRSRGLI